MPLNKTIISLFISFTLWGCAVQPVTQNETGKNDKKVVTPTPSPSITPTVQNSPQPLSSVKPDSFTFDPAKEYKVTMETNHGIMKFKLFHKEAPKAVENFTRLISSGYYNNLTFHRIIRDFMIQGGDPKGNGSGGDSIFGKDFEDEFAPNLKFNKKGILAMANKGANTSTNGSQFFITLVPTPHLNNAHTIFGEVTDGMNVLTEIGNTKTGSDDQPVEKVIMKKFIIE